MLTPELKHFSIHLLSQKRSPLLHKVETLSLTDVHLGAVLSKVTSLHTHYLVQLIRVGKKDKVTNYVHAEGTEKEAQYKYITGSTVQIFYGITTSSSGSTTEKKQELQRI